MPRFYERKAGDKCGYLTLIREVKKDPKSGRRQFVFQCKCLNKITTHWGRKSCGCRTYSGRKPSGEIGDVWGRLTLIGIKPTESRQHRTYVCKCTCGKISEKPSWGVYKSCGCASKLHMAEIGRRNALPEGVAIVRRLYRQYRNNAIQRDLEFNITLEEFTNFISKPCYYCGDPPKPSSMASNRRCNGTASITGIDRVNSDLGYSSSNCVPCCPQCNYSKRKLTKEEFFAWAFRLYRHSILNAK